MDHSGHMDMGGMDMNTSSSSFCAGNGMVMMNGFQSGKGTNGCVLYLFEGWVVNSEFRYNGAIVGTFFLAASLELISWSRRLTDSLLKKYNFGRLVRCILALQYGAQMFIAYLLMLLVMTYERNIFTAIIIGLTVGHAVFAIILAPPIKQKEVTTSEEVAKSNGDKNYHVTGGSPCCGHHEMTNL